MDLLKHDTKRIDGLIDSYRDDLIKSLRSLLSIPSVKGQPEKGMPFGKDINDAALNVYELCKSLGFETKNFDGYVITAEYGTGKEAFAVLSHLDVVPAVGNWTYPPFEAKIVDGKLYARGAADDKGPAMCSIYALKAIKEAGIDLNKRNCRLIFGTDEESGWGDIAYYEKVEGLPEIGISPDASYPVINSEKGLYHVVLTKEFNENTKDIIELKGGSRANIVPDIATAKAYLNAEKVKEMEDLAKELGVGLTYKTDGEIYELEVKGKGAHASTPALGLNAISALIILLANAYEESTEKLNALRLIADKIGMQYGGQNMGIYIEDETGDLTLNVGIIDMDQNKLSLTIDIRYPRATTGVKITDEFKKVFEGFTVNVTNDKEPHFVSEDHELVKTMLDVYHTYTGKEAYTVSIGGGTYARALKAGVAFGPGIPGEVETIHQPNEFEWVENYITNTKMVAAAIVELCAE